MVVSLKVKRTKHKDLSKVTHSGPQHVKVGFPSSKSDKSNIEKAVWNEFGTRRIPERPFMRNAMRNNRGKYTRALRTSARKILLGETALRTVLSKLGILAQGDIQMEITSLTSPPNAASTIRKKKSSKPLIDIGTMRQAVTWIIEE